MNFPDHNALYLMLQLSFFHICTGAIFVQGLLIFIIKEEEKGRTGIGPITCITSEMSVIFTDQFPTNS